MRTNWSRSALGASLTALLLGVTAYPAAAQRVVVPANTIIRAELLDEVRSDRARRGDRVRARIVEEDTSRFPMDTRFEGTVTEVVRASDDRPATLDMRFTRAILPGGAQVPINAELASLSEDDIRRAADGRLESRRRGTGSNFDWKWVGYGAGGGAILGQIFGGNLLRGALLGGLGGAIYSYLNRDRDRGDYRDIVLDRGTDFGMVLEQRVAFNTRPDWRYGRGDRVAGSRDEYRLGDATRVFVNDQAVNFGTDPPRTINDVAYVPLRPIANAAGWTVNHNRNAGQFTVRTGRGEVVRGFTNDMYVTRNARRYPLTEAPRLINGEIFVPLEWISVATDTTVNWNRNGRRVNLTTH